MEISQRVNIRLAKQASVERRLSEFATRICDSREGLWRFPFFGRKKTTAVQVKAVELLRKSVVYPRFERFLTIHTGEVKEITQEGVWKETVEMKAGTTQELGLKFSESAKFLSSKLGCEIVAKLKAEQAVSPTSATGLVFNFFRGVNLRFS